jgi:5-methylcytosine-specific restriction endonuclease McrA
VDTTVAWVDRLTRWVPVRAVHLERVAFDTHALSAGNPLEGAEYSRGTLHGYEVREYLLAKFGRTCVYCDASAVPLNIDHVRARSRGGSDRVSNLVLACIPCNQAKGDRDVAEFAPERASGVLKRAKASLKDVAAVQSTRWALWRARVTRLPPEAQSGLLLTKSDVDRAFRTVNLFFFAVMTWPGNPFVRTAPAAQKEQSRASGRSWRNCSPRRGLRPSRHAS